MILRVPEKLAVPEEEISPRTRLDVSPGYSSDDVDEISDLADIKKQDLFNGTLQTHLAPLEKKLKNSGIFSFKEKRELKQQIQQVKTAHSRAFEVMNQVENKLKESIDEATQKAFYQLAIKNPNKFKILASFLNNPTTDSKLSGDEFQAFRTLIKKLTPKSTTAKIIQRFVRRQKARELGNKVRAATVFPSEVKKFLDNNLTGLKTAALGLINNEALSKGIAREILELSTSGALDEQGVLLDTKKIYQFATGESLQGGPTPVRLPVEIWVKKTPDGVEIEMVGQKLGSGTYKKVFASRTFEMDLSTEKHAKSSIENTVAAESKNAEANINLLHGVKLIQDNFAEELKAKTIQVAGIVSHAGKLQTNSAGEVKVVGGRRKGDVVVARDIQYDGDLWKIGQKYTIKALSDVAKTLQRFHAKGIVHRDVKPDNILHKAGRGYLADFDLTQKQGRGIQSEYRYWDALSKVGYATPLSDAYGLARTTAEVLLGLKDMHDSARYSEDQIRAQLSKLPAEFSAIRNAIVAVFDANKKTLDYAISNPAIEGYLKSKDPIEFQKGVDALNTQFPAFNQFLDLMASY